MPTTGDAALIALGLLLAGLGVATLRRKVQR
ncbi:MAG: IPTL-CTERM sorting domain-containing protein [Burkholderiales bacterium]|nr:IPTL-CTERM sorting domain-containing protein [Burkholderiales bacterium]